MAPYFSDPLLEEQDEENPSSVQISGASATTENTGGDGGSSARRQGELKTGSGFQNLDKYLQTNQAQQFGQQTLGKVQGQVDTARNKMGEASAQFKNTVAEKSKTPGQDQINAAIADPTHADAKQYQGWVNNKYEGPNNLAESQDAWNKYWSGTQQAKTSTGLLGSEPGRFALLDQYFGKPSYNFGQKSLDNLLVQQSGLGRETRDLQNQATRLQSDGNDQMKGMNQYAQQRATAVGDSAKYAKDSVNGALSGLQSGVDTRVKQAESSRDSAYALAVEQLKQGNISPELASALGLTNEIETYGIDPLNFLKKGTATINKDTISTAEERARDRALEQLAGIDTSYFGEDTQSYDPNSAVTFDTDALRQASEDAIRSRIEQEIAQMESASSPNNYLVDGEIDPAELRRQREQAIRNKYSKKLQIKPTLTRDLGQYM